MEGHSVNELVKLRVEDGVPWFLSLRAHIFAKLLVVVEDAAELASKGGQLPPYVIYVFRFHD